MTKIWNLVCLALILRFIISTWYQIKIERYRCLNCTLKNYVTMSLVHPITFKSIQFKMSYSCLNLICLMKKGDCMIKEREREREGLIIFQNVLRFVGFSTIYIVCKQYASNLLFVFSLLFVKVIERKNNENCRDHTFLDSPLKIMQFVLPIAFYSLL